MQTAKITAIDRIRTTTDGEGVTTLVVFASCPLRCAYCINPFTWDTDINKFKDMSVEQLYNELKIDSLYFLATGGGICFGGGEPLLNHSFIREFIDTYKEEGWKYNMETSLSVKREFLDDVINDIDHYFVDSKDMDKNRYELYTKGNYDLFYENLMYLKDTIGPERITVRVPIIPEFHKHEEYKENAELLKSLGFKHIQVFHYVIPETRKKISQKAIDNKNEFLAKIKE
ncbi:MAG: radical SAM protein [Lachnospiraceae bacterium]|nr:radical SAM protein [Lachnospiraceae bacterium]